jgi:hypothetical protein
MVLFGGVVLAAIGAWTIAHPNGGYRAAGGLGSSFSPGTRRGAGVVLIVVAVAVMVVAITAGA